MGLPVPAQLRDRAGCATGTVPDKTLAVNIWGGWAASLEETVRKQTTHRLISSDIVRRFPCLTF